MVQTIENDIKYQRNPDAYTKPFEADKDFFNQFDAAYLNYCMKKKLQSQKKN